ncbi:MAG: RNA-directed DNA polymerase [Coriobacteriales bacterium]|nr:RNA-directed DNA polymerase [Coriobacteriales bacterium]
MCDTIDTLPSFALPSRRSLARARRFAEGLGSFEEVFCLDNLVASACLCKCGVSWKREVQSFHLNLVRNCAMLRDELMDDTYRLTPGRRFTINERGKPRDIITCAFRDRVVQRTLCDRVLVPVVTRVIIHDNGACIPGRGTSFALERLERHLREHARRNGTGGGLFLFDFSKYFASIHMGLAMQMFGQIVFDERLLALLRLTLEGAPSGLGLGNQTSQVAAVLYPNAVDHWAKDEARVVGYARYMDDGYALFGDWSEAREFAREFEARCSALGLSLNPRKTRVLHPDEEFTFLKTRFRLLADGEVRKRLPAETYRRRQRHVAGIERLVRKGVLGPEDLAASEASWRSVLLRVGRV